MENKLHTEGDHRPVPDPTLLTQSMILREISLLKEFTVRGFDAITEKFACEILGLKTQILERDARVIVAGADAKVAIDAAMSAQERAISKSELSVAKQLDQHNTLLNTSAAGLAGKIDDVKERVSKIEGSSSGSNKTQINAMSIITLVIGVCFGLGGFLLNLLRHV